MSTKILLAALVVLAGCAPSNKPAKSEGASTSSRVDKPTMGSEIVDAVTGRGAVRAGEKAKATIERVSAEKKDMLDEVMGTD